MKNEQTLCSVRCSQDEIATHSCLNQKCEKYAFVCQSEKCKCHRKHQDCLMVKIDTIVKSIKAKIISTQELEDCIENGIEKLIDQLSDFRDKILIKIKNELQFLGVSENEKRILSQLKEGNTEGITGSQMWLAHLKFRKQELVLKQYQETITNMKINLISLEDQTKQSCNQTENFIKQLNYFNASIFETNQKTQNQNSEFKILKITNDIPSLKIIDQFASSSIIKNVDEKLTISYLLFQKVIKSCKMLYRATQNGFDINKFHEKCDNINKTLTICETEFGQKIGGYTPIPWKIGSKNWVRDESGESFVFSLSKRDKFILHDKDCAVQHYKKRYQMERLWGQ